MRIKRERSAKRFGGSVLLLLLVVAMLGGCAASTSAGASAHQAKLPSLPGAGWTWYTDTMFPFAMPIPPKWQTHAFMSFYKPGDNCGWEADFVPPISQSLYLKGDPEPSYPEMRTFIPITCPEFTTSDNSWLTAKSKPITISGEQAILYYGGDDQFGIHRVAVARFGGHQYTFGFQYEYSSKLPSDQAPAQLTLYLTMLQNFHYTGK